MNQIWIKLIDPRLLRDSRNGVSLLELMLVVALLSVIAAISFPALRRNLARADATSAARELQQHLQRARLQAMESGEGFLFLAEENSGSFFLGPLSVYQRLGAEPDLSRFELNALAEVQGSWVHQLPLRVRLVSVNREPLEKIDPTQKSSMNGLNRSPLHQEQNGGYPSSEESSNDPMSDSSSTLAKSILFYPNGRIQSAVLLVESDDGYQVPIEIEGLAGRVKVGSIRRATSPAFSDLSIEPEDEK